MEELNVRVACPLGTVEVRLDRRGLELAERGGFSARWARTTKRAVSLEDYRLLAKGHLSEVYSQRHGAVPPTVVLNLASYQLADDLVGWTKLNSSGAGS